MAIYVLVIIYFIFGILIGLDKRKKDKITKNYYKIGIIILLSLSMFRSFSVGNDTETYRIIFNIISENSFSALKSINIEYGFLVFSKILSIIYNNPRILLYVSSCIIIIPMGYFIYKWSDKPLTSILLYVLLNVYFFHLTGMRQSIASAILLFAFECFIKKKKIQFFLLVLLAMLFHKSAIIFLIFLFIDKIKYTKKTYFYVIFLSIICYFFSPVLFNIFIKITGKYSSYADSIYADSNYFASLLQFIQSLVIYTFCHFTYISSNDNSDDKRKNELMLKVIGIDVCIRVMAINMKIFSRMNPYFLIFSIICMSNNLNTIKNGKNKFYISLFIIIFALLYWIILSVYRPQWNGAIPYKFYFE